MFVIDENPNSVEAEAYRNLRTNIQYSSYDKAIKIIVVTSAEPGEGKTTTAGNLALALVQDGKKVLLVDCDLRKPTIHKRFGISNSQGLSEVLIGKAKIPTAVYEHKSNLQVLTSGKTPPNPSEMLGSKGMSRLVDELRENYDYVILDSPPVQAVTDAHVLSKKADGTVLVVRAEKTKNDVIVQAVNSLKKINANIIGTVINGVEVNSRNYYYYSQAEK